MSKRERILVIEDDPDIQDVLRYNLKKEGYDVDVAGCPESTASKSAAGCAPTRAPRPCR
jgi:DNA-binding response OmpR family regulator